MKKNWLSFRIAVMISFSVSLLIFIKNLYNLATSGFRMQYLVTAMILLGVVIIWLFSIAFQALNLTLLQFHFPQLVLPSARFWQWYRLLFVFDCIAVLLLFAAMGASLWVFFGLLNRYPRGIRNYDSLSSLSAMAAMLIGNVCNCYTLWRSPAFIKYLKTAAGDSDHDLVNSIGEQGRDD